MVEVFYFLLMSGTVKKPAIVITRFPYESAWGGEESHTILVAEHFRSKGFEVIFMGNCQTLTPKFKEKGFQTCFVSGGKMIVTPFQLLKSFFMWPVWRRRMKRAFDQLMDDYDVKALYCLSLNEKLFLTPLALQHSIPVTWVEHQEIRGWLLNSPWKKRYARWARHVNIIPISPVNTERLEKGVGVPQSHLVEIVHGIDLKLLLSLKRQTQNGLVVFSNRLIPKKGAMDFLQAAKLLLSKQPELHFKLIGEGPEKDKILAFIQENKLQDSIELLPRLDRAGWHHALAQADVFVACARDTNETFSLNTAEALAAGCRVVVTRCSGIAHYLEDQKEAFLIEPEDPVGLSKFIERALQAPESMRAVARQAAVQKFDQERMLSQYESVILR